MIPTGSMAPTLMGRHKEITCPECGYVYTVNADREVDPDRTGRGTGPRIAWGTCENCRFEAPVADAPSFSGDRIYVMKEGVSLPFFERAGRVRLRRWDVAVFKLPEKPEVRYIKRLVGMPDEVLRIRGGDVWVKPQDGPADVRAAAPAAGPSAGHAGDGLRRSSSAGVAGRGSGWLRWSPAEPGAWTEPAPGTFVPDAATPDWAELRYRHLVPSPEEWDAIRKGLAAEPAPGASLITDYSSYNTDLAVCGSQRPASRLPGLAPAALGRRPDRLAETDRTRAGRPVAAGTDQGGPVQPLRDRPGHRRGAPLPRRLALGPAAATRISRARDLRPDLRQRRWPVDALGRSRSPVRRRRALPGGLRARSAHRRRPRAGPDRRATRRDRDRRTWS